MAFKRTNEGLKKLLNILSSFFRSDIAKRVEPKFAKKARKQKYRLEVMSDDGTVANVVNVGGKGHLLITVDKDSKLNENDFLLSELTAEDSITKKRIHLIDSNGCVANNSIIEKLSKPIQRQLKIDIKFLGFTDQAQVVYHAIAKPCKTGCILKCNIPYFKEEGGEFNKNVSFIRQKRADSEDAAVIDLDEPRSFDLEEDIYPLKTNNEIIVLNGPLKDENLQRLHLAINSATINFADVVKLLEKLKLSRKEVNYDSEEIKIQAKNGSFECLTEDMSCLLTIFLVVIQLSFLITCIIVVFLYARQLLRRADSSQREPLYSNYSVTNSSTDETEIEEIKS